MTTRKTASRAKAALVEESDVSKSRIRQLNETAILSGAERVFARAGFGGATMAQIAEEAGVPKPNLHYYFGNKAELYRAVLDRVLHDWLSPTDVITADADPREAIESYVRRKMALAYERPDASRVFANELLHGAPVVGEMLQSELRRTVREKAAVLDAWIAAGRIAPVDSTHFFFTLWANTQTYADFDVQIQAVLGADTQSPRARKRALEHVLNVTLRACGLSSLPNSSS
ncbi:TetR family transcriptional regulator C-terminal domain-containing protein [Uliginosibacterium aquaticum]|uniref:TetR family transcriptional regulator C-terminal domain-containing protein n=1 Tax=Uliginosibacterium aquaticum TaxID=2731212 RepID=A0ABX2ISA5_9RHOO|nr:TetR family transcriptional regulator C-terminal domain-containing protein [Uliginosibacterium aquaticum]NSL56875.1 TetR family transcriptional regulator C-terminal domain-containing protein [Uliginosibacterium aquaticum]